MSSIEPNDGGGKLDGGAEVSLGFVVAGCDGAELLELCEEILDQMACLEEIAVIVSVDFSVGLGRDHRRLTGRGQWSDDPFVGVEGLVGAENTGLQCWQKVIGADQIMRLTAG